MQLNILYVHTCVNYVTVAFEIEVGRARGKLGHVQPISLRFQCTLELSQQSRR